VAFDVLNIAVLMQVGGLLLAVRPGPLDIVGQPLGIALIVAGSVLYRREQKRRRALAGEAAPAVASMGENMRKAARTALGVGFGILVYRVLGSGAVADAWYRAAFAAVFVFVVLATFSPLRARVAGASRRA
jgi:hypothetical protein